MNKLMTVRQQARLRQWCTMVQEREESRLSIKNFCKEDKLLKVKTQNIKNIRRP